MYTFCVDASSIGCTVVSAPHALIDVDITSRALKPAHTPMHITSTCTVFKSALTTLITRHYECILSRPHAAESACLTSETRRGKKEKATAMILLRYELAIPCVCMSSNDLVCIW